MSSLPFNGAQNVSVDSTVRFTFMTPMMPTQSITWSANVVPANFTYSWSGDGRSLTCTYNGSFPANAAISWTLNPEGFKGATGLPLMPFNNTGTFTTGSGQSSGGGGTGPCDGGPEDDHLGSLALFKGVNYIQTHPNAPVIDPEDGAMFSAFLKSPATNPVTQATLRLPNGTTKPLTSFFGQFMVFEEFSSREALDAAYPAGQYQVTMKRATGDVTVTLNLAAAAPPTPEITNLGQPFDPAADSPIQWLAFAGVTPNDSLSFTLTQAGGTNFHAPDFCLPRPLANTATSIVVPKNTFKAGPTLEGSLDFMKITTMDTNSLPDLVAMAGYSKTTEFKLPMGGGTPDGQPRLGNLVRQANGSVHFQVQSAGASALVVEGSSDLRNWTNVQVGVPTSGVLEVTDAQAATLPQRFYRVKRQ
jgi:hypothetical protein